MTDAAVLVLNGDMVTRFVLGELASLHEHHGGAVTLAMAPYRSNWGVVEVDDHDTVHEFTQSPVLPYWVNAGAGATDDNEALGCRTTCALRQ